MMWSRLRGGTRRCARPSRRKRSRSIKARDRQWPQATMHVFFDEQTFVSQQEGGISRYFTELAKALGTAGIAVRVFGGISRNVYLPGLRGAAGVTTVFCRRRDRLRINTSIARLSRLW